MPTGKSSRDCSPSCAPISQRSASRRGQHMAEADPAMAESSADALDVPAAPAPRRRWGRLALMLSLPLVLLVGGFFYWQSLQGKVSTDNAYLKQDKVGVSAEIVGKVIDVAVREGQLVKAGDLLFRIDPEPYSLQIAEAD